MDIRADVGIRVAPARPLPPDWDAWRAHVTGGALFEDRHTTPHGWPVSIAEGPGVMHAVYSVLDQVVHARAVVPPDGSLRDHVLAAFLAATPVFEANIVALVDV